MAQVLGREDPLEKGMVTHFSIPAWRIPWTEESGRLQPMRSQRVDTTELLTLRYLSVGLIQHMGKTQERRYW